MPEAKKKSQISSASTAEYFSKNLQQVGFSSHSKAVLTTIKEAIDNALDACEEAGILPEVFVEVEKLGPGTLKNADRIRVRVEDNGPGIDAEDLSKVFGEYLASSKFGRGRCSRGQQGIGISAVTTWAQLTNAAGVTVTTKTESMRKAVKAQVEVDIKHNKGVIKNKETVDWDRPRGVAVEFVIDGRAQLNGEGGLLTYLTGTSLVNPHLTLTYKLPEMDALTLERLTTAVPEVPPATEPHPHTMKLGELIAHSHLFGRVKVGAWLKKGFSRISDGTIADLKKAGVKAALFDKNVDALGDGEFRELFAALQAVPLMAPSTKSVLALGEETLSKSIQRLGQVDFFAVVSRKPTIADFKPVQVEVAIARLLDRVAEEPDTPAQVLRFANRVPLQFDKSACAIVKAIESVNWRAYQLAQPRGGLPQGPYVLAVSVVSPFIKFKNASKETIDASEELVNEIRLALIQAGQRLSRHIRREVKANDLEEKLRHIEQFCPILVEGLCRVTRAPEARKKRAEEGLVKLLGRDAREAQVELREAHDVVLAAEAKKKRSKTPKLEEIKDPDEDVIEVAAEAVEEAPKPEKGKRRASARADGGDGGQTNFEF